jgi:hypothetical protein
VRAVTETHVRHAACASSLRNLVTNSAAQISVKLGVTSLLTAQEQLGRAQ